MHGVFGDNLATLITASANHFWGAEAVTALDGDVSVACVPRLAQNLLALLRCCYLVGAADDDISVSESDTLQQIATELDVDRASVNAIRHEFEPKLSTIKAMLRLRGGA